MLKKILIPVFLFQWLLIFSQVPKLSDKAIFSILTVDVANESHTLYGHTALRVKDSISGFDVVYNYGMFDFRTPNFLLKFTKGDLQYFAAVYPFTDFEHSYREENRSIYEQKLLLSSSEKQELFQKLNQSVFTNDKYYTYKFIDRNCTTKVIDVINSVLNDKPIKNTLHQNESYREVLYEYQKNQFYLNLGINIIFGQRPDQQAQIMFLPLDFMEVLKTCKHNGKLLSEMPKSLFAASKTEIPFSFWNSSYSFVGLLILLLILNKKILNSIFFSVLGLVGLFFITVSLYSLHQEVLWNYNLLLFNPLYLVLTYFIAKKNTVWTRKIALLCFLCLGAYLFYILNKVHLVLVVPIIITALLTLFKTYRAQKSN